MLFLVGNLMDVAQDLLHYFDTVRIIPTLLFSITIKSNPVSDALRTRKTKCNEVRVNSETAKIPTS